MAHQRGQESSAFTPENMVSIAWCPLAHVCLIMADAVLGLEVRSKCVPHAASPISRRGHQFRDPGTLSDVVESLDPVTSSRNARKGTSNYTKLGHVE